MSSEHGEKRTRIETVPPNSFTGVLKQLTEKDTLTALQQAAQESANTSISICQSSGEEDTGTLCFIADTANRADIPALAEQLEDILVYPDFEIIRQQRGTPYKNLTLLAPENAQNVQAFVDQIEARKLRK